MMPLEGIAMGKEDQKGTEEAFHKIAFHLEESKAWWISLSGFTCLLKLLFFLDFREKSGLKHLASNWPCFLSRYNISN